MASATPQKAILFLGATGGCGLSALQRSLADGHACIALCRTPSKLTEKLGSAASNLRVEQGNAHDAEALARSLQHPSKPNTFVDMVISSIGGAYDSSKMTIDDAEVCGKGMRALLDTIADLRKKGYTGRPRIVAVSTTGMSTLARDTPLVIVPIYNVVLKGPHKDKKVMEDLLFKSGEDFTVVRASWMSGVSESKSPVRAGMEDPNAGKVESKAIGYKISREHVGKWIFEELVGANSGKWVGKVATITY